MRTKYALWLVTTVALYAPLALLAFIPDLGWTYLAFFMGATVLWFVPTLVLLNLHYGTISYALTDSDVVVKSGLLTKSEKSTPYDKITNVEQKRGIWDRLLGLGTLQIHTAGYSQQTNAEAVLNGLDDWEGIRRQIVARMHEARSEATGLSPVAERSRSDSVDAAPVLHALLVELRAIRAALDEMRSGR
ncbi:MAG: PH domain-containing protein [Anaerolineae bacterium]